MPYVLADNAALFLGSRLKRLAERFQAGAGRVIEGAGLPVQPAHMPLLFALDRGPADVGELVEAVGFSQPSVTRGVGQLKALGLVDAARGRDGRRRTISLTEAGEAAMARVHARIAPGVEAAVKALCADLRGGFLDNLATLEGALAERPLDARAAAHALTIRDYDDALARDFHDINAEWIGTMFRLEPADREVLENPRERIIAEGGAILFVEAAGQGIVGACALRKTGPAAYELTKMGVRPAARGLKAGEFLLRAVIARAGELGADPLYLLTNRRCAAAIHLYEKLGFQHDAAVMADHGARYARCDVAMRYRGPPPAGA